MEKIIPNDSTTVKELKEMLQQGNEYASDLLWELTKADCIKAWDYVAIEDAETYLQDSGLDIKPEDVINYMKDNYELIDVDSEINNVCCILKD